MKKISLEQYLCCTLDANFLYFLFGVGKKSETCTFFHREVKGTLGRPARGQSKKNQTEETKTVYEENKTLFVCLGDMPTIEKEEVVSIYSFKMDFGVIYRYDFLFCKRRSRIYIFLFKMFGVNI